MGRGQFLLIFKLFNYFIEYLLSLDTMPALGDTKMTALNQLFKDRNL